MKQYNDYDSFMENFLKEEPENVYINRSYEKCLYFSKIKILYNNDGKGYVFYVFNNNGQLVEFGKWYELIRAFFRFANKFVYHRRSLMF